MVDRQLFDVPLRPAIGSRIQPTGFPDIGAAEFERPTEDGWVTALLVESTQSMANRLEGTLWPPGATQPHEVVRGLPYVEVVDPEGNYLTSSRTEAHRLASAFVKSSLLDGRSMMDVIRERLDLVIDRPIPPRKVARAVFELDPLCLIHGVFFADKAWPGQPKIARALTGFIEATDVKPVHTGGVKKDHVRHQIEEGAGGATEGYGTIPYHRTEYVAREITASFALDLEQLRSYGLADPATELLADVARWEIRALLDGGLRLRTACDLQIDTDQVVDQHGQPLPDLNGLTERVRRGIELIGDELPRREPLTVVWSPQDGKRSRS